MKLISITPEKQEIFDIVKNVACYISEKKLINNFLFNAKIGILRVEVNFVDTFRRSGIFVADFRRCGEMEKKGIIKLVLNIPESTDRTTIEFIAAHEFAHLIFHNYSRFFDYYFEDRSYGKTSVRRRCNGKTYGLGFEECMADYIAVTVVSEMNKISVEEVREHIRQTFFSVIKSARLAPLNVKIIDSIVEMFDSAEEYQYFDEIRNKGIPFKNMLLYQLVDGNQTSLVIADFDYTTEKGSWNRMLNCYDNFLKSNDIHDLEEVVEILKKRKE